jgi:ADP-ribosylation factor-like protein 2
LVFANKQDLAGALSMERIAETLELHSEHMSSRHWTISACSAVTGQGLAEGIDWIVADIASRIFISS